MSTTTHALFAAHAQPAACCGAICLRCGSHPEGCNSHNCRAASRSRSFSSKATVPCCLALGETLSAHCPTPSALWDCREQGNHRSLTAQGEGTGRAVRLARLVNAPLYVVHVMSKDALAEVQAGLAAGQRLFGEAVAGALALTDEPW